MSIHETREIKQPSTNYHKSWVHRGIYKQTIKSHAVQKYIVNNHNIQQTNNNSTSLPPVSIVMGMLTYHSENEQ